MKKILSIVLVMALCLALFACGECTNHVDTDPKDAKCDVCGAAVTCEVHTDADKDLKCDVCGAAVTCEAHEDANSDLKCDYCGAEVACVFHKDTDKDQKCDICGTEVGKENTDFGTTDSDFSDILG